jgi:cytoskeletal protein CcmA (bactofilin family)
MLEGAGMFDREKEKPRMDNNPNAASAFLGPGSKITGTVKLDSTGRIEGEVEGEIHARDLVIGESAVVKAQVHGATVVVHGTVVGDIRATSRLEIRRPAKVKGNISSSVLVIEEGASFEGKCSMGDVKGISEPAAPKVEKQPLPNGGMKPPAAFQS